MIFVCYTTDEAARDNTWDCLFSCIFYVKSEPLWSFINFVHCFAFFGVVLFVFLSLLKQRNPIKRAPRLVKCKLVLGLAVVTEPRQHLRLLRWARQVFFLGLPPVIRMDYGWVMEQIWDPTNRACCARMAYVWGVEQLLACSLIVLSKNVTLITRHETRSLIEYQCVRRNSVSRKHNYGSIFSSLVH